MSITFKVTGLSETLKNFKVMPDEVVPVIASALHQEHEKIMTLAKERTPVLSGTLRGTGHVRPPVILARSIQSIGAFGGPSAKYAVYVHERINLRHHVGRSKYYESAARERAGQVRSSVNRAVYGYFKSKAK